MKVFLLLIATISSVLANGILLLSDVDFLLSEVDVEKLKFALDRNLLNESIHQLQSGEASGITAVINEYADKIFANIAVFAQNNGLDPIILDDVIEDDILGSSVDLTDGRLNGIATIGRSDDVTVSYSSDTNILELYFPIVFSNLNFTYDYNVIVILLGIKGDLIGKIEHFEMDINLEFDLNTYHAAVKRVKTSNTGSISLSFHGNGIVNVVVNVLSQVVTFILQPLIKVIIEAVVLNVSNTVVDAINNAIDGVFNPTSPTTDLPATVENFLFM